jgi:orotate phosphoribosyltransferase-like protein
MSRSIPTLCYHARMLHLEGLSYVQIVLRLQVTRRQAWYLVNSVSKAGPLPLRTMARRAA